MVRFWFHPTNIRGRIRGQPRAEPISAEPRGKLLSDKPRSPFFLSTCCSGTAGLAYSGTRHELRFVDRVAAHVEAGALKSWK